MRPLTGPRRGSLSKNPSAAMPPRNHGTSEKDGRGTTGWAEHTWLPSWRKKPMLVYDTPAPTTPR